VRAIVSTPRTDRAGDIVDIAGLDLSAYRLNPVVLFMHDHDEPIARCEEIGLNGAQIEALVQFPPEGTCKLADEVYGLIKAGVINATSIGFLPKDFEFIDPKEPWNGRRFKSGELLEFSFVSVPANADALVIERNADGGAPAGIMGLITRLVSLLIGQEKAGRTLSSNNEVKLRSAHDAIGEVLSSVQAQKPEDPEAKGTGDEEGGEDEDDEGDDDIGPNEIIETERAARAAEIRAAEIKTIAILAG
jgi:HK97 family phage prohead protease